MLFRSGLLILVLYGFRCQKTAVNVPLDVFGETHSEAVKLISTLRTGNKPPDAPPVVEYHNLTNITCYTPGIIGFFIRTERFECTIEDVDGVMRKLKLNATHRFSCPTLCQVCAHTYLCSERSLTGIMWMPDGRLIDPISLQYGTIEDGDLRKINWMIFVSYYFIFILLTNIMIYFFSDQ